MTSQTPGERSIHLSYGEFMESEAIYYAHFWHASCILLGSAINNQHVKKKLFCCKGKHFSPLAKVSSKKVVAELLALPGAVFTIRSGALGVMPFACW